MSAPTSAPTSLYVRKQKAPSAPEPDACPNKDRDQSTLGAGVGMHSPTMQKRGKLSIPHSSIANLGLVTSQHGSISTKRVSFGPQPAARGHASAGPSNHSALYCAVSESRTVAALDSSGKVESFSEESAFLTRFADAPQRDVDTCIQFAMLGGPLVKHSSRAHRPAVLCTFRLVNDCTRVVWAEASKPEEEKYGLETSSIVKVLVGSAAAAEFEVSKQSSIKNAGLRLVLLLDGDEKLRLEALDKVSLRYWAFAFHAVSRPRNTPAAPPVVLTEVCVSAESKKQSLPAGAHSSSEHKPSHSTSSQSQARHDRVEALVQMLDAGTVSVDDVDEHGNTVLIVSAQNNNKRICKAVLRRGANILHQNKMGQTCLHFAFSLGYTKLGEYLISKGASETLRNTFGLTCRQGLAPCNALPQAPNSPIYGFITQRSHNTLQQQVIHSHSEAVSPKLSLSHGNRTPHRAFALASPSAAGSATDRPSPSAQRLRQQNNNSIMHPESNPTSALEASRFSPHNLTVNSIQRPSASEHGHSHRSPFNQRSPRNHGSHIVDANFSSSNVPAFDAAPATPERLSAVMQRACAAVATSGLLSKELSQLDSPHNSDAIRSTPVTTPIQSNGGPNQSLATPQRPRPLDAVVSDSILFHSSPNVESQAASIVAHCHTESSDGIRDVPAATNWDMSSEFLKNTPINAATAPVILIRRGSSNSSSDSTRSSRLQFVDDPATSEHKLDADFFVERQIETLQRQKLRSGISALRPTSAGAGARRSVRPDLVSGLGFKSIDSACLKTSDAIRLPPRPSTPVLGRYASAEEDIPLQSVSLPLSPGLASNSAHRMRSADELQHRQHSPLSTSRVAWGSPEK